MKNILLILLGSFYISVTSCSPVKDDFSSPEAAAESYFNVLKEYDEESVKSILLTYDEFIELKKTTPSFAEGLTNLGTTDDSEQYAGTIKESLADYTKNFRGSLDRLSIDSERLADAKFLGVKVSEEKFQDLTMNPLVIKFKLSDGGEYRLKIRSVKVGDKWKATYFGDISIDISIRK